MKTDLPHTVCPCCGHNLRGPRSLQLGNWALTPWAIRYKDHNLGFTPARTRLLYTLAAAYPNPVSTDSLMAQVAKSEDTDTNVIYVHVSRIKSLLTMVGFPVPFEGVRGQGYVWKKEEVA